MTDLQSSRTVTSYTQSSQKIIGLIDGIKEKLSDGEYKDICDLLMTHSKIRDKKLYKITIIYNKTYLDTIEEDCHCFHCSMNDDDDDSSFDGAEQIFREHCINNDLEVINFISPIYTEGICEDYCEDNCRHKRLLLCPEGSGGEFATRNKSGPFKFSIEEISGMFENCPNLENVVKMYINLPVGRVRPHCPNMSIDNKKIRVYNEEFLVFTENYSE